jgi:hypothetical protein
MLCRLTLVMLGSCRILLDSIAAQILDGEIRLKESKDKVDDLQSKSSKMSFNSHIFIRSLSSLTSFGCH